MVNLVINNGEEVLDNLWQNLINTGVVNRRHDSSRVGLLLSAIATELNVAITLLQSYANQFSLQTATDRVLIENLASTYANRRVSSKSKAILTFYRYSGYTDSVKIPAGFAVRSEKSSSIIFKTLQDCYLWKGTQSVSVMAYSISSGSVNNVDANTLTIFANGEFNGAIGVTNPDPAFGGYDEESINHLRNRAQGFRYERDNTLADIRRQLYMAGVNQQQFATEEYIDGPGTYLLCIDADSDYEFSDIISRLEYRHHYGIRPAYVRATRVYIDMYITIKTAGDVDYDPNQKSTIYKNINDTIQKFFAAYCVVGADININSLTASLNNSLSNFDIADIDIDIANTVQVNKRNVIEIGNTQRAYPNKILTSIEFVGGT
jgi:hypothetical protein